MAETDENSVNTIIFFGYFIVFCLLTSILLIVKLTVAVLGFNCPDDGRRQKDGYLKGLCTPNQRVRSSKMLLQGRIEVKICDSFSEVGCRFVIIIWCKQLYNAFQIINLV